MLFTLFGLDENATLLVAISLLVLAILIYIFNYKIREIIDKGGVKSYVPDNLYIKHNGQFEEVKLITHNERVPVDGDRGIYDVKGIYAFKNLSGTVTLSLRDLVPVGYGAVAGGFNVKRFFEKRQLTNMEKRENEILAELEESKRYIHTILEAYRKNRTIPEQFEEEISRHFKIIRDNIMPPIIPRPPLSRGGGYSGSYDYSQQGGGQT